jgi:predicted ATPase/transcriptional regulator with XRE-family HTH domain
MEQLPSPAFFGEWVKRRRKALDFTQDELASRAGCSVFTLRKIESGERRPSKQLAELLANALKIPASERLTFIRVARGDTNLERLEPPSLNSAFTSAQDLPTPVAKSWIPVQLTPLIGRDHELAAMERIFVDPQCRLLTLTGMGGIGKTRLAIEFASRQRDRFPARISYVALAPANSVEAIIPAIADTIGFVFSGAVDPQEQFINYVATQLKQPFMLVLDNLEHLLVQQTNQQKKGAGEVVSELLLRLPNIKILATSRQRLNLRGEWTYELHGLAVPPLELASKLEDYSATDLFLQSTLRANVSFEPAVTDKMAITQICQMLDGTPLAIELAAAWVDVLSTEEILQEIHANILFLATAMQDIPERHRSFRATIDHSWKLLTDEERNVLCRLSVFQGGFDRVAAEKIAGASLPLLASLVSKSLVRRAENGRYDLHEAIRQYARQHLEENPAECNQAGELHCEYYLGLVSGSEKRLKSAAQQKAVRELSDMLDNIRAAWSWATKQGRYEWVAQAARSIGWYFEITGLLREGMDHFEPLVQELKGETGSLQRDRLLGLVLLQLGLLYFRKGQIIRAQELYRESVAILRPIGEKHLLSDALAFLGIIEHLIGDYLISKRLLKECLEFAQASGEKWIEAYAIYNLGYVDSLTGRYQEGYDQMQAGLNIWRVFADQQTIALGLNFLIPTTCKLGRYEEAKAFMRESIKLCEQSKHRRWLGNAYRYMGLTYLKAGEYSEAQVYFYKSLETFGEYIEGWDIALSLAWLGEAMLKMGDLSQARQVLRKALQTALNARANSIAVDSLLCLAQIYNQMGKFDRALEFAIFIRSHPASLQETKENADQLRSEVELKLPVELIETAKKRAENLSLASSVHELIEMDPSETRIPTRK